MNQIDMFELMYDKLPKVNHLKVGTFFSGIGAPEKALQRLGIDYDLQFFSEIDKYAIKSYMSIHKEPIEKSVGSIIELKGDNLPYCDLWFGGFPCQDISLAGNLKGFEKDTRSSLGWEMIRLIREVETKPKYIVFENVANITSKLFKPTLDLFKRDLEELGYILYDDLLNAKDYGIPQNRNRYFLVAILGKYSFKFPKPIKLELKLKDVLEKEVDEKYMLSEKTIEKIKRHNNKIILEKQNPEVSSTIHAGYYKMGGRDQQYILDDRDKGYGTTISDICPTLRAGRFGLKVIGDNIRKLTPLECVRLMDFDDEDYYKMKEIISDTQIYARCGNSIVVAVLEAIFKNLFLGGQQ